MHHQKKHTQIYNKGVYCAKIKHGNNIFIFTTDIQKIEMVGKAVSCKTIATINHPFAAIPM